MTSGIRREWLWTRFIGRLEEAGASMENIVNVLIYFKDMKDYEAVKQIEFEYWKQHTPTW
jgi:enamine deaminase RidA (YjgF/YER057c/UK114 family)